MKKSSGSVTAKSGKTPSMLLFIPTTNIDILAHTKMNDINI